MFLSHLRSNVQYKMSSSRSLLVYVDSLGSISPMAVPQQLHRLARVVYALHINTQCRHVAIKHFESDLAQFVPAESDS